MASRRSQSWHGERNWSPPRGRDNSMMRGMFTRHLFPREPSPCTSESEEDRPGFLVPPPPPPQEEMPASVASSSGYSAAAPPPPPWRLPPSSSVTAEAIYTIQPKTPILPPRPLPPSSSTSIPTMFLFSKHAPSVPVPKQPPTDVVVHIEPALVKAFEKAGPAWLLSQKQWHEKCRKHFNIDEEHSFMESSTFYVKAPNFFAEADLLRYAMGSVGQRRLGNNARKATFYCEGRPVQVRRDLELPNMDSFWILCFQKKSSGVFGKSSHFYVLAEARIELNPVGGREVS